LLQGYNLLALGDDAGAARCFRRYTEMVPDDAAGHEGLLAAAQSGEDPGLLAVATAALGQASRDPKHAARLFEEAADIFSSRLDDPARARAALERAVELDITRRSSFTRLFDLARDAADPTQVLSLIERRLAATDDREELATLHWERARAARKLGQTDVALAALDGLINVTPDHSGALALYGEIYITQQRYAEAADKLAQLAARDDVPREERLTSGLAAVDLYDNQLGSTKRALSVLLTLHRAGLSTLPVRERLARAAAKSEAWDEAVVVLEQLMFERSTLEERAEAARLALAIHRDRRHEARSAGHAAEVLLGALPGDAEALDLALSGALEPVLARKLLVDGKSALARALGGSPLDLDALRRLSRIADRLGDLELRQISVGALVALGQGQSSSRAELAALDQRIHTTPPVAIPDDTFAELGHPEDAGAMPALLGRVAAHLGDALGPTPSTFKVTKRDRISASAGMPVRSEIAAWVGAFGLGEFELYLSAMSTERIAMLATTPLFVVMGTGVNAPLGALQRQELVRALYAARRGLLVLTQLDEADAAALIVALCKLGGVTLETPRYARQDDFGRQLARGLPRKVQKALPPLALAVREEGRDVAAWVRAALYSLDRAAALAVGDVSVIHADVGSILSDAPPRPSERTVELLRFVLSPTFEAVRRRLGIGVR
jgi:tetratricopeptide (TPR) repeat protein